MHELSLAEGMLELIEAAARDQGFERVRSVRLEIGQLAAVEREALAFCFDAVTRGSLAEGARLEMIEVAATGRCRQCGQSMAMETLHDACTRCEAYGLEVTGGTEMRIRDLEVE